MFLFEFTITACFVYHLVDKCLLRRKKQKIKRSERTNKYILVEKTQLKENNEDLEDAKTLQYFFNKLRLNKQIKEFNKNDDEITKKMFNKKKNINRKLTKRVKQLEKENKELHKIILDLQSKQNKIDNDELSNTYILPRTII